MFRTLYNRCVSILEQCYGVFGLSGRLCVGLYGIFLDMNVFNILQIKGMTDVNKLFMYQFKV